MVTCFVEMMRTKISTIGFTRKPARRFFDLLRESNVRRVVDVRLNNGSQLAGFAKKDDLAYFLGELCEMEYIHVPELAPTKELLDDYRKRRCELESYDVRFNALMRERRIEETVPQEIVADGCLLFSEDEPHRCHRRLVAGYLKHHWGDVEIVHLR